MNEMSIRDELRTYSKGDLTRIAVLATRKQYAAEQALKAAYRNVWLLIVAAFSAGFGVAVAACVHILRSSGG